MAKKILVVLLSLLVPAAGLAAPALPADRGTVFLAIMPGAQVQQAWDIVPVKLWAGTIGRFRGEGYAESEDQARRLARAHGADYFVAFYGYEETPTGQGGLAELPIPIGNGRTITLGGERQGETVKVHLLVQRVATDEIVLATFGPRRAAHITTRRQGELGGDELFVSAYGWGASRSDALEAAVGKLPLVALPAARVAQAAAPAVPVLGDGPIPGTPLRLQRLAPWQVVFVGPASMNLGDLLLGVPAGKYYARGVVWKIPHWQIIEGGLGRVVLTSPRWLKTGDFLLVDVKWHDQRVGIVRIDPLPAGQQ